MNTKAEEAFRRENERQSVTGAAQDPGAELRELSDEELDRVAGGAVTYNCPIHRCKYDYLRSKCVCQY